MKITLPALLLLVCAGCRSTASTSTDFGPATGSDAAIEARLEMLDPQTIGIGTVRRVDLALHNTSDRRLVCLVTADWYDEHGQTVPLVAHPWIHLDLDAGETRKLSFDPMPPAAQSFRLRYAPAEKH